VRWYLEVLKKYAVFGGRAGRTEYWMFVLFNMIFTYALMCIDVVVVVASRGGVPFLTFLYMFAIFIPSLAVTVRRFHDTGKSGWWSFISIIPLLGTIVLMVLLAQPGQPGANKYGPDPKLAPSPA